ncbi:HzsA-related protein [Parabacteroides gordonii]|uniref:HzsA-related protein n=1 Tax=Parabacteroides gordonii TaxID=574930 RepID=UPI000EBB36B6|nr:SUMF1/EgtB/PvdO family nonheme iron enzyme [Parabacteroides gordonii]RGP18190.1 formylglycine-generating enzyme family protein [Parabacteroides gordonii]
MKQKNLIFCIAVCLQSLFADAQPNDIQNRLKWVNPEALELAIKDMSKQKGYDAVSAKNNLSYINQHLQSVKGRLQSADSLAALKEAEVLLEKQRAILLSNPLLDMDKVIVTRFVLGDKARIATTNAMCMPMSNYMGLIDVPPSGYDAEICELSHLRDKQYQKRTIYKPTRGEGIADVQLHWNADKMLFASSANIVYDSFYNQGYPSWRIFEIGVDGKDLKMVSDLPEPDLEYADPCYLPDGRILFTTNIGYNGIPCEHGQRIIMNLAIYDPKDKSMRKITFDQDGNWSPTVLNNGRIMYTRWEYTDLTHYFSRIIMHSNPDGTECKALYGSGSYWPTSVYDMQQLPNAGNRFIGIVSGHHGIPRSGQLIIFDPSKGRKEVDGVVQEVPFRKKKVEPVIKDQLVDGVWPQFSRPYPLNDKYFLVTAKLHEKGLWGVYLVDVFDNLTLLAESEGAGYLTPIPLKKRPVPPVIPDRIKLGDKNATVFIQDLYEGEGLRKVPRGTVEKLRLFTYEYAYMKSPSDFDTQGIQSGWDMKRELGTVDVEEDGSVIFQVPANTPISIQPLDANGNAIQWMRSWFTAMPGEVVSCIGCHEDQNMIPIPKRVAASMKKPSTIVPPKDGVRSFTFDYEIQPILDKYCITCHDGNGEKMDLTDRERKEYVRWGNYTTHRFLTRSYLNLHPYVYRQGPEADMYVLRPYEYHASNSELIQMLEKGHHQVEVSGDDMRTLCKWIDFNAPYFGTFEIAGNYKEKFGQYDRRQQLMKKYGNISVDWKKELRDYSKILKDRGDVKPVLPKTEKPVLPDWKKVNKWCFSPMQAKEKQQGSASFIEKEIELKPGVIMRLVWIPEGSYMKGEDIGAVYPVNHKKVSIQKGFWMGSIEVSNEQYKALCPEHDSRYIGQQWKDHTTPGYPANEPKQSVIRVSWDEAMEFCKKLSEKTGMKVTLPTEEQWEWACRAGSGEDMWYGDRSTDYSKFENLADFTIKDLAVWGMEPTVPMPDNAFTREFWDFVPRDRFANDGSLISVAGGQYQANPWGLYDMHGNVSEWTNSECRSNGKYQGDKVVCGGSWRDRADKATASYRRYYKPWQAPFNVGFRVVVEAM